MIIGITGTLGAGKGLIAKHLVEKYQFLNFSARDFLSKEVVKRGLTVSRGSLTQVANDLRAKNSSSFVIMSLYNQAIKTNQNAILESLRTVGEVEAMRQKTKNFVLLSVDADPKIRYQRILDRNSSTVGVSWDQFLADEMRELHSKDYSKQNLFECNRLADYRFENNLTPEDLFSKVDKVMEKLLQS